MKTFVTFLVLLFAATLNAQQLVDAPKPVKAIKPAGFFSNDFNRSLAITDLSVRVNDIVSTRLMADRSNCYDCYEKYLPRTISDSNLGMTLYSVGYSLALDYLAAKVGKHHKWIARTGMMLDIASDGYCGIHNWTLFDKRPVQPIGIEQPRQPGSSVGIHPQPFFGK